MTFTGTSAALFRCIDHHLMRTSQGCLLWSESLNLCECQTTMTSYSGNCWRSKDACTQPKSSIGCADQGLQAGHRMLRKHHADPLTEFMRKDVTPKLGIIPGNVSWGSQGGDVFKYLAGDFMVDSIASVDSVLASGRISSHNCPQRISKPGQKSTLLHSSSLYKLLKVCMVQDCRRHTSDNVAMAWSRAQNAVCVEKNMKHETPPVLKSWRTLSRCLAFRVGRKKRKQ